MFILVSERDDDLKLIKSVESYIKKEIIQVLNVEELKKALTANQGAWVFFDVDHTQSLEPSYALSLVQVAPVLGQYSDPRRTVVLSDLALNRIPYIFDYKVFSHHLYRRLGEPGTLWLSQIILGTENPSSFTFNSFNLLQAETKKMVLTHSRDRQKVINELNDLVDSFGIPSRLVSSLMQSLDELLMNAIFDAPCDSGARYRFEIERTAEFDLSGREVVNVEFFVSKDFLCISVADSFGSLEKDRIFKIISVNYENKEYQGSSETHAGGLGIYGILQSGLSFVFVPRPNLKTEAILLVPLVQNMKDFRTAARFFSIM